MPMTALIVGAGPAGCYLAQALRKADTDAEITIMDRLPVPYGLVRYGVAPDHQGTKAVTKQFARLFERQNIGFVGNVTLGGDLSLDEAQALFDVVVLATGLSKDRSLGADFEGLDRVYGAGQITRYWNGHPDEVDFSPEFGRTVTVVGNGNVALDVVRLLLKSENDFLASDIPGRTLGAGVKEVNLVGRSPAEAAKCDPAMVRELMKIDGLGVRLGAGSRLASDPHNKTLTAFNDLVADADRSGKKVLRLHFGASVQGPALQNGTFVGTIFDHSGSHLLLHSDSLISAIGFEDNSHLGRDDLLNKARDVATGRLRDGLYATGWFRRGPTGTIPDNRLDAQAVAKAILEDMQPCDAATRWAGRKGLLKTVSKLATSYEDWCIIDAAELANAMPDRVRAKFTTVPEMLACREMQRGH